MIGQKWYKFDDGDVSEAKMDDDEELRAQCYGGEYTSGLATNSIFFSLLFCKKESLISQEVILMSPHLGGPKFFFI